jgi:TPR repeat protein
MKAKDRSLPYLAAALIVAGCSVPALSAAEEYDLKDETGKTIVHYIVETPAHVAPVGTTDPARQVGVIFCFQEHTSPPGADIFPVRESLKRLGLSNGYVLLAIRAQDARGGLGPGDHVPIQKLLQWAEKTYPVNPRRIYMYGKGAGGYVAGEFTMSHPDLVTASISYSWGWWTMPSELDKPLDPVNSAPEFYMVLGMRDFTHHITTVRDTYERVKAKGYHVIYREFEELGERSYHPTSNDDAIGWATRLRNKNIPPSPEELNLLAAFSKARPPAPMAGYYPTLALVGGAPAGAVLEKLFVSSDAGVRAAAAETCNHGIFGEATTAALGKLLADPSPEVRNATLRALASYANWRSAAAQQALIQRATDQSLDLDARLDAADGIAQAIKLQATGVQQDPPMFRALVSLIGEEKTSEEKIDEERVRNKNEPLQAVALLALAPIRRYIVGGADEGQFPPEEGWEKWLQKITAQQAGDLTYYSVCGLAGSHGAGAEPDAQTVDLFCAGGALVSKNPAQAFQSTLQAAQGGYVPAEEVVGMMYAIGKGVQQDYHEAGKWFLTAAEAGNTRAATNYVGSLRSGMGNLRRDPELSARWAKFLLAHPEYSPVPGR